MIKVEPKEQPVILMIEKIICQAAPKAEQKQIEIEVRCDERIWAAYDLKWTQEALGNILDNAVKYTAPGGCGL